MRHLDLFSGIGGFSIAVDAVWPGAEHTFCDNDRFCQAILKKHYPNAKIYSDIRELTRERLIADTSIEGVRQVAVERKQKQKNKNADRPYRVDLLTGGFPCQPFSNAGRKRGEADDRYLWPEMLRVIRETKPTWIIGENVAGIINMALEQVCSDLEREGYEVQAFVIPAASVGAPHRRDRVWIVGHSGELGELGAQGGRVERDVLQEGQRHEGANAPRRSNLDAAHAPGDRRKRGRTAATPQEGYASGSRARGKLARRPQGSHRAVANADEQGLQERASQQRARLQRPLGDDRKQTTPDVQGERRGTRGKAGTRHGGDAAAFPEHQRDRWRANWVEVATELCGVDDGLPGGMDGLELSKAAHRNARLKALGNAIVPQVAIEIMKGIKALS